MFIYDINYDFLDFLDYLKVLGTFNAYDYGNDAAKRQEIIKNFLTLTQFLQSLSQTINVALENFGSKSLKSPDGTAESNAYGVAQSKMSSNVAPPEPKIYFKSKQNEIKIYNYGYDFTGYLKKSLGASALATPVQNEFAKFAIPKTTVFRRDRASLPTIQVDTYNRICEYLFFQLLPTGMGIPQKYASLEQNFNALGIDDPLVPNNAVYSYLNIPEKFLKYCLFLPETVIDKDKLFSAEFMADPGLRTQILFYNIIKFKKQILEDNLVSTSVEGSRLVSLQEDITSVLNFFGLRVPQLIDVDYTKELPDAPNINFGGEFPGGGPVTGQGPTSQAAPNFGGEFAASLQESSFQDDFGLESPIDPAIDQVPVEKLVPSSWLVDQILNF